MNSRTFSPDISSSNIKAKLPEFQINTQLSGRTALSIILVAIPMFTDEERRFVLPRKLGDRLVAFIFGCVLTVFFALMHFRLESQPAVGWLGKLLHALAVETMFTFAIFSLLALVWALFTPHWLETLLTRSV